MVNVEALGFTLDDLVRSIAAGEVRSQTHPNYPELSIFNYTEEVQYKNKWNDITLACRGLILNNQTGEVVARPWKKFFNFGQRDNEIDSYAPVEVTDKLDGSLGILYKEETARKWNGGNPIDVDYWAIATRGSFASEQAIHASNLFNYRYGAQINQDAKVHEQFTFLFEIIYPDNRIVVDYGNMDDLVLLGAVDKKYGWYMGPAAAAGALDWDGPIAETFEYDNFVSALSAPDREGKEGIVIRSGNKMVKLKQADYVELHRIVTNLSPKTIWEMMSNGQSAADICAGIPDEFHAYVKDIADTLFLDSSAIVMDAKINFTKASAAAYARRDENNQISRRVWAEEIKKFDNAGLLFSLLDGRDIKPVAWKMVKPRGDIKTLVKDDG